jgi:hypothetical protein
VIDHHARLILPAGISGFNRCPLQVQW